MKIKTILSILILVTGFYFFTPKVYSATMAERLSGKFLLQTEEYGEAWYVNPVDYKRYYVKDGETAYNLLRDFGLGITNEDLNKIPVGKNVTDFSIIVIPDTQKAVKHYPEVFINQMNWIKDQLSSNNIVFVTHLGDLVDDWDDTTQWEIADKGMSVLDNKVPYGISLGNHDYPSSGDTSFFNQYFPPSRFSNYSWYGGNYPVDKNDNSFQLFSAAGNDYIIIHLQMCPTHDVIDWANQVLKNYSNRRAIITTHGFLDAEAKRNVHSARGGCTELGSNTKYIWEELIYPNLNTFLVLSGHVHSETKRTDENICGRRVHQLLADYQERENGGNGWLRILKFSPSENRIYVKTYSPFLDQYETDGNSGFVLLHYYGEPPEADSDYDGLPDRLEEALGTDLYNADTDGDGYEDALEIEYLYSPTGPGKMPIDYNLVNRLKGRILLQVEEKGQAWYLNPADGKRYYIKDGDSAFQIMKFLSLGITNSDLAQIEAGN